MNQFYSQEAFYMDYKHKMRGQNYILREVVHDQRKLLQVKKYHKRNTRNNKLKNGELLSIILWGFFSQKRINKLESDLGRVKRQQNYLKRGMHS